LRALLVASHENGTADPSLTLGMTDDIKKLVN